MLGKHTMCISLAIMDEVKTYQKTGRYILAVIRLQSVWEIVFCLGTGQTIPSEARERLIQYKENCSKVLE